MSERSDLPYLDATGLMMHGGTIVDATIIAAPPSTKNKDGERDSEMHQIKKCNERFFGMKVYSGVDAEIGYVYTITSTAANVHDSNEAVRLLHADMKSCTVLQDTLAYLKGANEHLSRIDYRINQRLSSSKCPNGYRGLDRGKVIERQKSTSISYVVSSGKSSDVYQSQTDNRSLCGITMPIWESYAQEAA